MEKHIDKDCIFCKLANGEIPTTSIYEDEDFNVIMDLGPASRGHSIILPKTHAANLYELPDDYCSKIMGVAKKCAAAMKKSLNCDGLNVLQNNGEAAGQSVFHLQVHLIPRYKDDQVNSTWNNPTKHEVIQCLTIASYCITVFKDNNKHPRQTKTSAGGCYIIVSSV